MTTFHGAIQAGLNAVRAAAGITVSYRRGEAAVEVTAVKGQTRFEQDDRYGVRTESAARDWLIAAADLVLAEETIEPERGDRIAETVNGETQVYEVLGPGAEPAARWSDPNGLTWRIHTKYIGME